MSRYDYIINTEHFDLKHIRMSIYERSSQFDPFAALTGYSEEVKETARYTEDERFIDENYKDILDRKLEIIKNHLDEKPEIKVNYFVPDKTKSGGKYVDYIGNLKKIDYINKQLCFTDNKKINIFDLKDLDFINNSCV